MIDFDAYSREPPRVSKVFVNSVCRTQTRWGSKVYADIINTCVRSRWCLKHDETKVTSGKNTLRGSNTTRNDSRRPVCVRMFEILREKHELKHTCVRLRLSFPLSSGFSSLMFHHIITADPRLVLLLHCFKHFHLLPICLKFPINNRLTMYYHKLTLELTKLMVILTRFPQFLERQGKAVVKSSDGIFCQILGQWLN